MFCATFYLFVFIYVLKSISYLFLSYFLPISHLFLIFLASCFLAVFSLTHSHPPTRSPTHSLTHPLSTAPTKKAFRLSQSAPQVVAVGSTCQAYRAEVVQGLQKGRASPLPEAEMEDFMWRARDGMQGCVKLEFGSTLSRSSRKQK